MVEIQSKRPDHLGYAAAGDAPHHLHLSKPQMRVDKSERNREIAVAFRLDKWDVMVVPADRNRAVNEEPNARQVAEPRVQRQAVGKWPEQFVPSKEGGKPSAAGKLL